MARAPSRPTRVARRTACVAVLAPLLAVVPAVGAGTTPAQASGGRFTTPDEGAVTATADPVTVRAEVDAPVTQPVELRLLGPGETGDGTLVARLEPQFDGAGGVLTYDLDPDCAPAAAPCGTPVPTVNGAWTATLTGGASDRRTLVLRVPPAAPSGVRVDGAGGGRVTVSWDPGPEPDLVGWTVLGADGRPLTRTGDPGTACTDGRCRALVTGAAVDERLAVQAERATCPDCPETLPGPASEPVARAAPGTTPATLRSSTATTTPSPGASGTGAATGVPLLPGGLDPVDAAGEGVASDLPLPLVAPPPDGAGVPAPLLAPDTPLAVAAPGWPSTRALPAGPDAPLRTLGTAAALLVVALLLAHVGVAALRGPAPTAAGATGARAGGRTPPAVGDARTPARPGQASAPAPPPGPAEPRRPVPPTVVVPVGHAHVLGPPPLRRRLRRLRQRS